LRVRASTERREPKGGEQDTPLRVLLVCSPGHDASPVLEALRRGGFEPRHEAASTPGELERALSGDGAPSPEVVLAFHDPALFGAWEALSALRATGCETPLVVVCRAGDEEAGVELMRAGAQDCVTLAGLSRLSPAVERELREAAVRRERARAEEELRVSEERFRVLAEEAIEGIVLSEDGRIFDANPSFSRMFGYDLDEIVGTRIVEFVPPDDREMVAARLAARDAAPYECRGLKNDGSTFPIEVRPRHIPYYGRQVRVSSVLDLTERKRAEEALRTREEEYRAIFELAGVGKAQSEPATGRLLRVNPKFCEITGYTASELLGMSFLQLTHPEDRENDAERFRQMLSGEGEYSVEKRYVRKDGQVAWVNVNATAVRDADGSPVRTVATIQDITERKLAETALLTIQEVERRRREGALLEAEERFRSAFENAPIGVAIVGLDGRFLQVNRSLKEMLGYSGEQLLGLTFSEITHPEDVDKSLDLVRRVVEGEVVSYSTEKRYMRANGEPVWVSLNVSLVRDASGAPRYFVDQIQDITDRKLAERELAVQAEALASTNRELEAFSYSVSHDLRAPLRAINGFAQILLEDHAENLDAEGREYLGRVQANSERMGRLIDDLLALSRVSRTPLRREPVDLSALAREALEDLKQTDPNRRVTTRVEDGLWAEGDPRLLRVALGNLLGNAWKFTLRRPEAHVEFGLTQPEDGAAEGRVFFVRDDGAGFDMTYADKLFGAFQRLHTDDFEGTGIGLATVQRVVRRHGGEVWAEGAPDRGATFFFTLDPVTPR
jgi:PAS domain S-box-containing protein